MKKLFVSLLVLAGITSLSNAQSVLYKGDKLYSNYAESTGEGASVSATVKLTFILPQAAIKQKKSLQIQNFQASGNTFKVQVSDEDKFQVDQKLSFSNKDGEKITVDLNSISKKQGDKTVSELVAQLPENKIQELKSSKEYSSHMTLSKSFL